MDDGFIDDGDLGDERSFYHRFDGLETTNTTEGDHEDGADDEKVGLLCRKGVFCYDYFNSSNLLHFYNHFYNHLYY